MKPAPISTPDKLQARLVVATKSVEDRRRIAFRDHARVWDLIDALKSLASIREEAGDFARAECLYREAIAHASSAKVPRPEIMFELQSHLAYLYDRLGQPERAIDAYRQALAIGEAHPLPDPDRIGVVNNNLALLHKQRGDFVQAANRYETALAVFRSHHGEVDLRVASVYNNLGVLHYSASDTATALAMHQRALAIRQELSASLNGAARHDVRQSFTNLSHIYSTLGDEARADFYRQQASALAEGPTPATGAEDELSMRS